MRSTLGVPPPICFPTPISSRFCAMPELLRLGSSTPT